MVKTVLENGKAIFVCPQCQKEFCSEFILEFAELYEDAVCPECIRANNEIVRLKKSEAKKRAMLASLDERMKSAGFPGVFCQMENPIVRHNAEFMWRKRDRNLLISGETGAGKTSSAAFVFRVLMKERKLKVMYRTWSALHSEYVAAKMRENKTSEERFFSKLNSLDYLVIDELAWRRGGAKLSPAAQELLWDIIDKAYNQERKCKVWIMGNLYGKAFETMLDDPEPTLRRLQFSFLPTWMDATAMPKEITVYQEKGALAQ